MINFKKKKLVSFFMVIVFVILSSNLVAPATIQASQGRSKNFSENYILGSNPADNIVAVDQAQLENGIIDFTVNRFCAFKGVGNFIRIQNTMKTSTRSSLKNKIRTKTSKKISKTYYNDFDRDGVKELFALVGNGDDPEEIWYASDSQVKQVYNDGLIIYTSSTQICKVSSKQKLIVFETGAYGSGSVSVCYYVKNGKVVRVKKAGEQLTQRSGKEFVVHQTAFDYNSDGTGHTWKAYYLKWNGKKFVEYKGKKISLSKLKKYKGATKYIKQIKKLKYKIGKIYYRFNGIINMNLSIKSGGCTQYENITLKVTGKSVKLQVNDKTGKNIVDKSSYGGRYQAKGF